MTRLTMMFLDDWQNAFLASKTNRLTDSYSHVYVLWTHSNLAINLFFKLPRFFFFFNSVLSLSFTNQIWFICHLRTTRQRHCRVWSCSVWWWGCTTRLLSPRGIQTWQNVWNSETTRSDALQLAACPNLCGRAFSFHALSSSLPFSLPYFWVHFP